jgi:hypothetical protein
MDESGVFTCGYLITMVLSETWSLTIDMIIIIITMSDNIHKLKLVEKSKMRFCAADVTYSVIIFGSRHESVR